MNDRQDIAKSVIRKALETTVTESVESIGGAVLRHVLPAVLANPTIAVLSAAVEALVEALSKETDQLEKKIDAVLLEPMTSAVRTLTEVMSVSVSTPEQEQEVERQLNRSYDNLGKALSYAEKTEPDKVTLIRVYMAFTAALKSGGEPFAELHIGKLRETARSLLAGLPELERNLEYERGKVNEWNATLDSVAQRQDAAEALGGIGWTLDRHQQASERWQERINETKLQADDIENVCELIETLGKKRHAVLWGEG